MLFSGLGLGVIEQLGMSLVNLFFDKRCGIAMGIASAGAGAGTIIFPPFANYLFEEYGYQGTCFILSAVALNGLIAGTVIITPEAALKLTQRPNTPTHNSDINKNCLLNHIENITW